MTQPQQGRGTMIQPQPVLSTLVGMSSKTNEMTIWLSHDFDGVCMID